jgi:hypothetical protein
VTVEEPGLLGCAVWLCNLLPKLRRNYRLLPKGYDSIHGFETLKTTAVCSFEMSRNYPITRCNSPENLIPQYETGLQLFQCCVFSS